MQSRQVLYGYCFPNLIFEGGGAGDIILICWGTLFYREMHFMMKVLLGAILGMGSHTQAMGTVIP